MDNITQSKTQLKTDLSATLFSTIFSIFQLFLMFLIVCLIFVVVCFLIPFLAVLIGLNMCLNGGSIRLYRNPKNQLLYDLDKKLRKKKKSISKPLKSFNYGN